MKLSLSLVLVGAMALLSACEDEPPVHPNKRHPSRYPTPPPTSEYPPPPQPYQNGPTPPPTENVEAPTQPAATAPPSILRMGALARLAAAAVVIVVIWGAMFWAMS